MQAWHYCKENSALWGSEYTNGTRSVVMVNAQSGKPVEAESVPLKQKNVFLKAECDFRNLADRGYFFYSLDGKTLDSDRNTA